MYRVERLMENGRCQTGFYNGIDDERWLAYRDGRQMGAGNDLLMTAGRLLCVTMSDNVLDGQVLMFGSSCVACVALVP